MSAVTRRSGYAGPATVFALIGLVIVMALAVLAAYKIGAALTPVAGPPLTGMQSLLEAASQGTQWWPAAGTWVLVAEAVLLIVVIAAVVVLSRVGRGKRQPVDNAARHLARPPQLRQLTQKGAEETAAKLQSVPGFAGLPLGRTVLGARWLYSTVEWLIVDIWGPRTGKTSSMAIPGILAAPGAVVATSNKRDIVDVTQAYRATQGRVWVLDPQSLAEQAPTWWWNPLSFVVDDTSAAMLADHFASGSRAGGGRDESVFDQWGRELLAGFFLAAAIADQPITHVLEWLTNPDDEEPVTILRSTGFSAMADMVAAHVNSPDRQRAGTYSTASGMAQCLRTGAIAAWITPQGAADPRPRFNPHDFVRSTDTLYLLSKEGAGTATPIVTALTAATIDAAEKYATSQPGGRLHVPLVGILDEAANVCRWRELPNLYSHYGSRGILLRTILQSWSQGVEVWGREGMKKLWGAANVATYGGGAKETEFLSDLVQLCGTYSYTEHSSSSAAGQSRSTTVSQRTENILDVADLASLPAGRALVVASGSRPTLVRTVPWWETQGEQIKTAQHADAHRAVTEKKEHNPWLKS